MANSKVLGSGLDVKTPPKASRNNDEMPAAWMPDDDEQPPQQCRVCTMSSDCFTYSNVFEKMLFRKVPVAVALELITGLEILTNDDLLPATICCRCEQRLLDAYHFRKLAESTERTLLAGRRPTSDERRRKTDADAFELAVSQALYEQQLLDEQQQQLLDEQQQHIVIEEIDETGKQAPSTADVNVRRSKRCLNRGETNSRPIHAQLVEDLTIDEDDLPLVVGRAQLQALGKGKDATKSTGSRRRPYVRSLDKVKYPPAESTAATEPATGNETDAQNSKSVFKLEAGNNSDSYNIVGFPDDDDAARPIKRRASDAAKSPGDGKQRRISEAPETTADAESDDDGVALLMNMLCNEAYEEESPAPGEQTTFVMSVADETFRSTSEQAIVVDDQPPPAKRPSDPKRVTEATHPPLPFALPALLKRGRSSASDLLVRQQTDGQSAQADGDPDEIDVSKQLKHGCEVCGKRFVGRSNLIDHLRHHANVRPYECPHCDRAFVQKGSLNCHLRTHTGERPFVCKTCNKAYSQASTLQIHMRTHTLERCYVCPVCSKGFYSGSDLSKHERTHDDTPAFRCDVCGMGFAQRSNMRKHMSRRHPDEYKAKETESK